MRWLGLEIAQQLGVFAAPEEDTNDLGALAPGDWAPLSLVLPLRHTYTCTRTPTRTLLDTISALPFFSSSQVRLDVTDE